MKEAADSSSKATRRYAKASSMYQTAVTRQLRRKGTTLASSPSLPSNRKYHRDYSRRYRAKGN